MPSRNRIYPYLLFIPLIVSAISYLSPTQTPQNQHQIQSTQASADILNPTSNTNINTKGKLAAGQQLFFLNLSSGAKSIYERKAELGSLKWGDDIIPIFGYVSTIPINNSLVDNQLVRVQASQNGDVFFDRYVKTAGTGIFNSSFYPPADGTVKVKATLLNNENSTAEALITIIVTQAWMPAILITLLVAASITSIVGFYMLSKKYPTKTWLTKAGLIPAVVLNVLAYVVLYKFPPFDVAGNTAVAAALIAPMAAYVYEALRTNGADEVATPTPQTTQTAAAVVTIGAPIK